jgi:hypothetical protein
MISTPVAYLTDRTYAGYDANGNWRAPVPSTSTPNTPVTSGAVDGTGAVQLPLASYPARIGEINFE